MECSLVEEQKALAVETGFNEEDPAQQTSPAPFVSRRRLACVATAFGALGFVAFVVAGARSSVGVAAATAGARDAVQLFNSQCDCAWASVPNACSPQATDSQLCWSVCCHGGASTFSVGETYDSIGHGDAYHGNLKPVPIENDNVQPLPVPIEHDNLKPLPVPIENDNLKPVPFDLKPVPINNLHPVAASYHPVTASYHPVTASYHPVTAGYDYHPTGGHVVVVHNTGDAYHSGYGTTYSTLHYANNKVSFWWTIFFLTLVVIACIGIYYFCMKKP